MERIRKRHPIKEIEAVIQYAEKAGWRYQKVGRSSHGWGRIYCPLQSREGCSMSIWSTPRNYQRHAQQIKRLVDKCPHH